MQRLKILNIGQRLLSNNFLVKNMCVSKYLEWHGKVGFTRNIHIRLCTPPLPTSSVVCHRFKSSHPSPKGSEPSSQSVKGSEFSTKEDDPSPRSSDPSSTRVGEPSEKGEEASAKEGEPEKLTLFKRYKKMLKEYWYVLLPVHMVTSALWFGGFYYAATQGLDIVPFLEYINLPEYLIEPLRNSSLGYIAVASAIYKLATPARYMVTVGGTTFAVKFLTRRGLIRPAPTKQQIKTIIQNKMRKDA